MWCVRDLLIGILLGCGRVPARYWHNWPKPHDNLPTGASPPAPAQTSAVAAILAVIVPPSTPIKFCFNSQPKRAWEGKLYIFTPNI